MRPQKLRIGLSELCHIPLETPGTHRDLRGHVDAHRCRVKSLIVSALMGFGVRQHARRESISKRARSTTRTSLRFGINGLRAVLNSVAQNLPSNRDVPRCDLNSAVYDEKRLSEAGQTIVLPLLVAREFHAFTFVFNGELEKPLHDPSRELASGFGFAFGRSFTRKVAPMIELRTESSIDFQRDRLVLVNAGIIDGVRNVVVYANIGHSVFSDDGGHFYAGGVFKVVIGR